MDNNIISSIADVASIVTAIIAIVLSIWTYFHGINKERRKDTIEALKEIRKAYFNTIDLPDKEKLQYINELEYFATGVNTKIYDLKIVDKMSGSRLIRQYDNWMAEFIRRRRSRYGKETAYCECEKMITGLKKRRGKKK